MQFKRKATISRSLDPKLTWVLFSSERSGFLVGDEKRSFSLPLHQVAAPSELTSEPMSPSCNLPIPASVYDEIRQSLWHGLQLLDRDRAQKAPTGDLLRFRVFAPDYGDCFLHPATGAVLSLRGGSISLLDLELKPIEKTKTRGKAALAFAAHPTEGLIAYGDNFGTFHAQRFDAKAFGKAGKIIAKDRKASRLEFINGGSILLIGGMGYLQTLSYADGKFTPQHETSVAVRDFVCTDEGRLILVNQGMHGIAAMRYDDKGFTKLAEVKPGGAIQQIAANDDGTTIVVSDQELDVISVYELVD